MYFPILIIGTAPDGPDGPFLPRSVEEAENTFGWSRREYYNIQSTQVSASTSFPIWGNSIDAYKKVGSRLYKDFLYNLVPRASGTYVTFGSPGTSGTYLLQYVAEPDSSNIVWAMKHILEQGAEMPWLYRIPGEKASVTIGDLLFQAEYSGIKYNGITIVVTGTTLTITSRIDLTSQETLTYSTTDKTTLVNQVSRDRIANKHPLLLTCYVSSPSVPSGTYYTAGGTNGEVTPDTVEEAMSSLDLDNIGVILIAGGPSTGTVSTALNFIDNSIYGANIFCLIAGTPDYTKDYSASSMESFLNSLPFQDSRLFYVPGVGTSINYLSNTKIPLSHIFAGLWVSNSGSPTNKKTTLNSISPYFSSTQLNSLGEKYCVFNKFIINNLSPYRSSPTDGGNPLIAKVKTELARRITNSLEYLIGEPSISPSAIYKKLETALEGVENVRSLDFSCTVDLEYILIDITVYVEGELREISFNLVSRRNNNVE